MSKTQYWFMDLFASLQYSITPILRGISLQEKSLRSKQDQGLKLDRTPKEDFS